MKLTQRHLTKRFSLDCFGSVTCLKKGKGHGSCQLSVVSCRMSVVGCWLLVVGCWLSGELRFPYAFSHWPLAFIWNAVVQFNDYRPNSFDILHLGTGFSVGTGEPGSRGTGEPELAPKRLITGQLSPVSSLQPPACFNRCDCCRLYDLNQF